MAAKKTKRNTLDGDNTNINNERYPLEKIVLYVPDEFIKETTRESIGPDLDLKQGEKPDITKDENETSKPLKKRRRKQRERQRREEPSPATATNDTSTKLSAIKALKDRLKPFTNGLVRAPIQKS